MSLDCRKMVKWLLLSLTVLLMTACAASIETESGVPAHSAGDETSTQSPGQSALGVARNLIGTPYRYGGSDPRGFDCSGLVQYSFKQAGVQLPRTSREIFRNSQLINPNDLQPGDLIFFAISPGKVSHVGIYDGGNNFIHAPSSGKGVSYASLANPYWRERLFGASRP